MNTACPRLSDHRFDAPAFSPRGRHRCVFCNQTRAAIERTRSTKRIALRLVTSSNWLLIRGKAYSVFAVSSGPGRVKVLLTGHPPISGKPGQQVRITR